MEISYLGPVTQNHDQFEITFPPWLSTGSNEEINYEMVFYRTPEYSVREYVD